MIWRLALALALVASSGSVSLVEVYPNPATDGDTGEFVVLEIEQNASLDEYSLSDGEDTIDLPNRSVDGAVAVTDDPRVASRLTDHETVVVEDGLALSNGGETVTLLREGEPVSTLTYDRAPTAEVWDGESWTPIGSTDFPVVSSTNVSVTAFALPDTPTVPLERIEDADRRILLAGYTMSSPAVADALLAAHRRGVDVAVLVDESPVGGTSAAQVRTLDRLSTHGIEITASGGPRGRYRYHHAKYAVVDDTVLVTSENWKPAGVGGKASRGWGVVLEDRELADHLAAVFVEDTGWVDGRPWANLSPDGQSDAVADGRYPTRFAPVESRAASARVLVAPDNAESAMVDRIGDADESIRIQQVSIDEDGPLLDAAVDAARRGVSVRILLGGAWYVEDDNTALAENLTRLADAEDLPLTVRLVEPRSRYDHLHAKGMVVDEHHAVVGSLNWNPTALRENREVAVVVSDPAVGQYYTRLFRADWRGAAWRIHWSMLAGLAMTVIGAVGFARTFDFDPATGD
ncbi:MAG: phospholipase D-like domain-containing protein [Halobacteriota archaeon]